MKCRIWTYILVVLVFVLPICTVTAMKLDAQSELRGGDDHIPVGCRKKCESKRVNNGANCDGRHKCGDCIKGTRVSWDKSWCVHNNVPAAEAHVFDCTTRDERVDAAVRECVCPHINCVPGVGYNTTTIEKKCVTTSEC